MSRDDYTLETSEDGRFRVLLMPDEYADEPYDDGQSPLMRLDYTRNNGWVAEHVMATGRPLEDDSQIEAAVERWGSDFRLLEKYLRAYYGMREIETWHSGDYWYITYDTARWREYIGFEPDAETPHPLVNMDEYRAWCEGDCWSYAVKRNVTWQRTDDPAVTMATWETEDSCAGFYGYDYAKESALEAFRYVTGTPEPAQTDPRAMGICRTCTVPGHDTCALVAGCSCCADTIAQMASDSNAMTETPGSYAGDTIGHGQAST